MSTEILLRFDAITKTAKLKWDICCIINVTSFFAVVNQFQTTSMLCSLGDYNFVISEVGLSGKQFRE